MRSRSASRMPATAARAPRARQPRLNGAPAVEPLLAAPSRFAAALESPSRSYSLEETCVVCSEPLLFCTLLDCGHRQCCSLCAMRMHMLMNDAKCVLCKRVPSKVFVIPVADRRSHAQIADQAWGERTHGFTLDEPSAFYFADGLAKHLAELRRLREPRCDVCASSFTTADELCKHLTSAHKLSICPLCLQHGGRFLRELPLMTRNQLAHHNKSGDANSAFGGHPSCRFCPQTLFYNDDGLYKHLKETHEACFICARLGSRFQYFDNFAALNAHFAAEHFMCPDPTCIQSRFSVFATELELSAHFASEHPSRLDSRSFAMPFVVRGSREDAAAAADASRLSAATQALPVAADFPALPSSFAQSVPVLWSSSRASAPSSSRRLDASDFPAISARSSTTTTEPAPQPLQRATTRAPAADAFPSLPPRQKRASVRFSRGFVTNADYWDAVSKQAVERLEQWQASRALPEAVRDIRGPRQDATVLLLQRDDGGEEDDDERWGPRKAKGKKPPGKNAKHNMIGLLQQQ